MPECNYCNGVGLERPEDGGLSTTPCLKCQGTGTLDYEPIPETELAPADFPCGLPVCPMCGGPGNILGELGYKRWCRCRNCGMDFEG